MDDGTDFKNIVAASDRLKARWHATVDHMTKQARDLLSVELTPSDIIAIPSARLAVLTDDPISESWLEEAKRLPVVAKAAKERALKAALEAGEESAHSDLSKLPRAERISRARELGIDGSKNAGQKTAESEAVLLRRCLSLSPQQRISFARANGLL